MLPLLFFQGLHVSFFRVILHLVVSICRFFPFLNLPVGRGILVANTASSSEKLNIPFVLYILSTSIGREEAPLESNTFLAVRLTWLLLGCLGMELAMGDPSLISNHQ